MGTTKKFISTKDYLVSEESFDLYYNEKKDLLKTHPVPPADKLYRYYESDEYISHTDQSKGMLQWLYQIVKSYSLKKKVGLLHRLNGETGTLLDIGAGTGDFALAAKNAGWEASGTEPSAAARSLASEKGLSLGSDLSSFADTTFDVVTLWHVLEHIHDLDDIVTRLGELVKPNGHLIVAVPNFKSFDAQYYKQYWAAYDVPRHIWHFSKGSIERVFQSEFDLREIRPMIFDSFYVSLLSEKYKTGNRFSLKAFWIGLMSNLKARKNREYSSLIYCFKRKNTDFK